MKQQTQDKAPAAPSTNIGEEEKIYVAFDGKDKFTGGEWETEFCLDQSIFIKSGEEYICCIQGEDQVMTPTMEANAALISQAPKLYDIAKRVAFIFGNEANYPEGTIGYNLHKDATEIIQTITSK